MSNHFSSLVIGDHINELPKSTLPASAADESGHYPFICSSEQVKTTATWLQEKPAVLMGMGGVASVNYAEGRFAYSTDTWGFRSKSPELRTEFLFRKIQEHLPRIDYAGFEGSGLRHLRKDFLRKLKIDVPSPTVQSRIVEILDGCDAAISQTKSLIAKYQKIKAGLMHDLFTRGVTADGKLRPPREQAPELYQETPIGWIPKEWDAVPAIKILFPVTKGTTPAQILAADDGTSVPFIRVQDLAFDRSLVFDVDVSFISNWSHRVELSRSIVVPGDILMNIVGPPLGKVSVVPSDYPEWNVNQAIAIFRPRERENTDYLAHYLLSRFAQRWLFQRAKQTSGQVNITLEMCNTLPIPWPKRDREREAISGRLNSADRRIGAETALKKKLENQKCGLMHDLLTGKVSAKR